MRSGNIVIIGLAGLVCAGIMAVAGGDGRKPLAAEVNPSSTLIVAACNQAPTNAWTASAAAVYGEVVHVLSNYFYWVTVAGTFETNAPSHYDGDHTNGTATLRFIHRDRSKVVIRSLTAGNLWLAFDNTAETNKGLMVRASAADTFETYYQGAIYAISSPTITNTALVHEE